MTDRSLCVIFNNVDETSSIGSLSAWAVRTALAAGWRVSVVARDLADDLQGHVEWLPLYVPPRLHVVQWYAARATVERAIGGRQWDVVHVQQPQLAGIADMLHLHYLVKAARLSAEAPAHGLRARAGSAQARLTEVGESRALKALPEEVELVPVSAFLAERYASLYGPHPRTTVLANPAPEVRVFTDEERSGARARHGLPARGYVLGFLGGADPRKGGAALLRALAGVPDVHVLFGGSGPLPDEAEALSGRVAAAGYVSDLAEFLAACDGFAAVSTFDPSPLAPLEALAHGVPVLGRAGVGGVSEMVAGKCAVEWTPGVPLRDALEELSADAARKRAAAFTFAGSRSRDLSAGRLLALYDRLAEDKRW